MAGSIFIPLKTVFDNKGIKNAQAQFAALGRSINSTLNLAFAGGAAAIGVGVTNAVKAASNLSAEFEGVNQVFGAAAASVQEFAKQASATAGLSETEALQAAKTLGLFAKSAGLSSMEAASFSKNLVQLAGDLGSFNDVPAADALAAIQSGLQGQAEPLRKFGVFLTDDALKAEALSMNIYKGTGALSAQQKMLASYSLILKSTNVQQGDFVKYADTFGNSTKTITKDLENLSAQIGMQLIPIIEELLPSLRDLIPVLGEQLKSAVESVDWKSLFKALIDGLTFLIKNGDKILAFVSTIYVLTKAFAALKIVIDLAQISTAILNGTMLLNPYVAVAAGVIALAAAFSILAIDARKANDELYRSTGLKPGQIKGRVFAAPGGALPKKATGQGGSVMDNYLASIPSVPAESDYDLSAFLAAQKAADDAAKATAKTNAKNSAAAKAAAAAIKVATDAANAQAEAYLKAAAAAAELMTATGKMLGEFTNLFKVTPELGAFEQAAVDAFSKIFDTIDSALADEMILKDAASALREYATNERNVLQALAKQRDVLAGKIDVARAITTGVTGLLNITGLLETTSKSVTQTVSMIINGISVATTKTFDVVESGGLIDNFQKLVDKTKAFAKNLLDLKKLGLNKQLFAQLVNAGADAGGATAEAIVAGGADTIQALNSLYNELALSASDIASNATDTLYEVGQQVVSNGFIEGLLSQDSELQRAAQTLADAFASTFQTQLQLAVDAVLPNQGGLIDQVAAVNMAGGGIGGGNGLALKTASAGRATIFNVNVSAGVVTDPNGLARTVIDSVKKYERSNGSVWVAA
jgi:F420-dependent methylenetetrahydromethanopterin dehydrogenase